MTIEGVKGVQTAGYQATQAPQTKTVETADTTAVSDTAAKVNSEDANTGKSADGQRKEMSNEQIKKAVTDMNKKMSNTSCQFGIHEGTGRVTIKIVDKQTKEVIKEFPAEETLEMIEKAWELAGIMVDEKL